MIFWMYQLSCCYVWYISFFFCMWAADVNSICFKIRHYGVVCFFFSWETIFIHPITVRTGGMRTLLGGWRGKSCLDRTVCIHFKPFAWEKAPELGQKKISKGTAKKFTKQNKTFPLRQFVGCSIYSEWEEKMKSCFFSCSAVNDRQSQPVIQQISTPFINADTLPASPPDTHKCKCHRLTKSAPSTRSYSLVLPSASFQKCWCCRPVPPVGLHQRVLQSTQAEPPGAQLQAVWVSETLQCSSAETALPEEPFSEAVLSLGLREWLPSEHGIPDLHRIFVHMGSWARLAWILGMSCWWVRRS